MSEGVETEFVALLTGKGVKNIWRKATSNEDFYCVEGDRNADPKYIVDADSVAVIKNGIAMLATHEGWQNIFRLINHGIEKDVTALSKDAEDLKGRWEQ